MLYIKHNIATNQGQLILTTGREFPATSKGLQPYKKWTMKGPS